MLNKEESAEIKILSLFECPRSSWPQQTIA